MGCGASNNAVPVASNNNSRPANTVTTPPVIASRPLIATKSYRYGSSISQRDLNKQRADFWATRTDGNAQMWQAIKSSAEALIANDVSLANAIVEASNITTPNGSLEVCYDERGHQYKVPQYCVANPVELNQNSGAENMLSLTTSATIIPADTRKNPVSSSTNNDPVTIKIRINPGDHNLTVTADATNSILELKQVVMDSALKQSLPISAACVEPDRQRVIFMGRELQNHQKIADVKFDEHKVVQVFLRPVGRK